MWANNTQNNNQWVIFILFLSILECVVLCIDWFIRPILQREISPTPSNLKSLMACLDEGGKEGEWRGVEYNWLKIN